MIRFGFPKGFMFGTGTSSYQTEGSPYADGKGENIWDRATQDYPDLFKNNAKTEPGASFYKRYAEDIAAMKEQGLTTFRFSISWARILPEGTGRINQKGIDHYNKVIDLLLENGIEPFVDLFHWDLPYAIAEQGGFKNRKIIDYFVEYAKICFENFGDRVKLWSTMNEPSVFCFSPYATGNWPPYEKVFNNGLLASQIALICHYRTVKLYRQMNLGGKIGAVIAVVPVYPKNPASELDVLAATIQAEQGTYWWLDPIFNGKYPETVINECSIYSDGMPENYAQELLDEFEPVDMIGLNYYYPGCAEYRADLPLKSERIENYYVQEGQRFQYYPAGIYDIMLAVSKKYNFPEIYIAENGLGLLDDGDKEKMINDDSRIEYIKEHLRMVSRCIDAGANIKGYYYWSNTDSFENRAGYTYRFGLSYVEWETGERIRKKSWSYYQQIAKTGFVD